MERQLLTFSYRARNARGEAEAGVVSARTKADALRDLQRDGKAVVDLRLGEAPVDAERILTHAAAGSVKRDDVIAFTAQLAVMLETGVPLAEALRAFVQQSRGGGLKRVMEQISQRITSGSSFSEAITEFPKVFPNLMISLMKASEASGKMGMMLGRVSAYLAKERRTARQIKGALTYPIIMITLAMVITIFLVVWVLPRFARIYESREAALPPLTKFVLGISGVLINHWAIVATVAATLVGAAFLFKMLEGGRRIIDIAKVRLPVIGPMFSKFYLTRATRTLGTLLASGVPLLDAVRIVRGVTENRLWWALWDRVEHSMTTGHSITDAIVDSPLIPPAVVQMIAAGERTGRLPEVLERVSQSAEEDLDEAVKNATQLIEPAMIIFMGITIGGIAIALLLPIFSVANVMAHH